jgi:hypothetical protein
MQSRRVHPQASMTSPWNLQECIPSNGVSTGVGRVSFENPDGEIKGPTTAKVLPDGHVSFQIQIEEYLIPPEYHDFLFPFLGGETPEPGEKGGTVFRDRGTQKITGVEVKLPNGVFRAPRALMGHRHLQWPISRDNSITVVPNELEFVRSSAVDPEIWCVPLVGDLGSFSGAETASSVSDHLPYISFRANGAPCGLYILPSSEDQPSVYAAVAFGEIAGKPVKTVSDIQELLPDGLITGLSFAAGSNIRAPWIDLRTFAGQLQRRFHLRFGASQQDNGFPAFGRYDTSRPGSGIAAFLDRFFSLAPEQRHTLIPPLNLIRSGAPGSATVDESIADLVKALDALCKIHRLTHQVLITRLDSQNAAAVEKILEQSREELKQLRKQADADLKLNQLPVFSKIISRQANVALEERDFGLAVSDLLRQFDLFDADAMNAYYHKLGRNLTWEGLLSFVRGQVIHSAAIPVKHSGGLLAWFEFARHLHDICKRIVLRQIGYSGTYAASNVQYTGQYEVDRVKATMTEKQLGYTIPPVPVR